MLDGISSLPASYSTPARSYAKGIGDAVADRTINRLITDAATGEKRREVWAEVAERVAKGNTLLHPADAEGEFDTMHHHLRQASLLMSGRHLQHGDETQPTRPQEVFTNCSTAAATFLSFYLLLNGSGVGRAYDDAMMLVDWTKMPIVVPVIKSTHPDAASGEIKFFDANSARHVYRGSKITEFMVPDSREGWAKAIEQLERMTFERKRNHVLILDFSNVRPKGSPIKGMQDRPASGPLPLMVAIANVARLRSARMKPWRAAMYADHYFAECVLVGGARRAARMATKTWRDRTVLDFVRVKQGGFLWSSNNSVTVDEEFWKLVRTPLKAIKATESVKTVKVAKWAKKVFRAVMSASFKDGTGEPGFINQDMLTKNLTGIEKLADGNFAESARYKLDPTTLVLTKALYSRWVSLGCPMIVNPCGEIVLSAIGGYCVIADVVPYHATSDEDAESAFRTATRALMRTNLMNCLYEKEVKRTNRIGVGITGFHEWAWSRFGFGWKDIVDEEKSLEMWMTLSRFKRAVVEESHRYAEILGVEVPHTNTTFKPAGTTSKLFALTEGAHLPAMREYLRWVQFRNDDPLIEDYRAKGYPVRELMVYKGTTIVGFPTSTEICKLGMGKKLITAGEATPREQFQFLRLLEKYWIRGVHSDGTPLPETGNQVSYTLKIDPKKVSFNKYVRAIKREQPTVRCCSVMLQEDVTAYEYVPEQAVTKAEFEAIRNAVMASEAAEVKEDIGVEHVDCAGGVCPISFNENR